MTTNLFKSSFAGLLTTLSVLGFAAVLPSSARATILYQSAPLPNYGNVALDFYASGGGPVTTTDQNGQNVNITTPTVSNQVDLGVFSFGNAAVSTLADSLVGLQVTLTLNSLDTYNSQQQDYNSDYLTIDGINTGILLNGFGDGTSRNIVVTGNIANAAAASAIDSLFLNGGYSYQLLTGAAVNSADGNSDINDAYTSQYLAQFSQAVTTSAGQLVVGVLDTNPNNSAPDNVSEFNLVGGTATLAIADTPIPFEPSQAAGFGLIALFIAMWYIPQTKQMMQRLLVPAKA